MEEFANMNESLQPDTLNIPTPPDFSFEECLAHLMRSEQETVHQVINYSIYKAIKLDDDEPILFIIEWKPDALHVRFPLTTPSAEQKEQIISFIREWFDLTTDLNGFYELAKHDPILSPIVQDHFGLRIMGIPNLFEALTWAIIGQQINLTFAYTLKKRLVEKYGDFVEYEGKRFYTFPSFEMVASLTTDDLRALQFSSRKAEYIIGIAQLMKGGKLDKDLLFKLETFEQKHLFLTTIRGIGPWTADYVLMKSLQESSAFPISDVGLHNALKKQLNLDRKPTMDELKELAERWKGWQAYATFYLWRSL